MVAATSHSVTECLRVDEKVHVQHGRLVRQLGVGDVAGLVKFATQHGLTPE